MSNLKSFIEMWASGEILSGLTSPADRHQLKKFILDYEELEAKYNFMMNSAQQNARERDRNYNMYKDARYAYNAKKKEVYWLRYYCNPTDIELADKALKDDNTYDNLINDSVEKLEKRLEKK